MRARPWIAFALALGAALGGARHEAHAFPYVVRKGDTLASVAERMYGSALYEQVLVVANGLDAGRSASIAPGMRIEVPAVGHRRVEAGETWASLADEILGARERYEALAMLNDATPWIPPAEGREIVVPYTLRVVMGPSDSLLGIAYRFLRSRERAWMLDRLNGLDGKGAKTGDVLLVPVVELPLTEEGKRLAAQGGELVRSQGAGAERRAQERAASELPELARDVAQGRWIEAVSRGSRLEGLGELTRPQRAEVARLLTEALVALDARGLARDACGRWRENDPTAELDPVRLSPKILRVCAEAAVSGRDRASPSVSPSTSPSLGAPPRPSPSARRGRP